jgi:hypothetical protein
MASEIAADSTQAKTVGEGREYGDSSSQHQQHHGNEHQFMEHER